MPVADFAGSRGGRGDRTQANAIWGCWCLVETAGRQATPPQHPPAQNRAELTEAAPTDSRVNLMSNIYHTEPATHGKVLLHTSFGDIDIELWGKECPKACRNFVQLAMEGVRERPFVRRTRC